MTDPIAGSNPALGTMKQACAPDTPNPQFEYQQPPTLDLFHIQVMSRTAKAWIETPSKISSVRQRRDVIRNWVVGNDLLSDVPDTHSMPEEEKARVWKTVFETVELGISKLRSGKLDIYKSINAMVLYMKRREALEPPSPATRTNWSSCIDT